jgi:PAS domain-containing protein
MNNIVELMGQLANTEERTKTSRKIAKTLGAETVFIFVKDDELGMLLPAQGFAQTITCMQSWQPFIKKCLKNKFHKGALHYPDETTTKSAVAISYRNELVFLLIGGKPDTNKLNEVTDLLPLVASMLKHELYKSQTEVQLKIAEKSLLTNNEVVSKLYATRHELRTSLALLRQETEARQTTEKELSNQQKLLHELFMQAPAVIAVLQGSNHTFKLANPLYKKLIGGREVVGRTVKQALPELAGQGIYELLDKVYKTGKPFIGNEVLVKLDKQSNGVMQDGYYNFVYQPSRDGKNKVTGILIHAIDVTEQVIARQKVQASEEQLRFMAESMLYGDGINLCIQKICKQQKQTGRNH